MWSSDLKWQQSIWRKSIENSFVLLVEKKLENVLLVYEGMFTIYRSHFITHTTNNKPCSRTDDRKNSMPWPKTERKRTRQFALRLPGHERVYVCNSVRGKNYQMGRRWAQIDTNGVATGWIADLNNFPKS